MEVRFRHFHFPKKSGTALSLWTCTQLLSEKCCDLLRKTKLQNAYSPHTPHSGGKKRKKERKSAACQSWTESSGPFMDTKGRCTWATNAGRGGTTRDRVIPSSAHTEHTDCSFMKWKCPRKRKCEGGVLSHFFPERGAQTNRLLHVDIENKAWDSV